VRGRRILCLREEEPQATLRRRLHAMRDHRFLYPASAKFAQDASVPEARDGANIEEHPGRRVHAVDASEIRAE
jgi:hypothetical protein